MLGGRESERCGLQIRHDWERYPDRALINVV